MDFAILILNYNGAHLLKRCIEKNLSAMKSCSYAGEMIVVDNASGDESEKLVNVYPEVQFYKCKENLVLYSYNQAVRDATKAQYVLLLNNDEWLDETSMERLIDCLRASPDNFLAVPKNVDPDTLDFQAGYFTVENKKGHLLLRNDNKATPGPHLMSLGCLGAYRRSTFLELGGFERLLLPFYWEDADLSYRASKAGFRCYYCPEATTEHMSQATISKFPSDFVHFTNRRNKLLFFYLNVSSWKLWINHVLHYPVFCLLEWIRGNPHYIQGLLWLLFHLPAVLKARSKRTALWKVPDESLVVSGEWEW